HPRPLPDLAAVAVRTQAVAGQLRHPRFHRPEPQRQPRPRGVRPPAPGHHPPVRATLQDGQGGTARERRVPRPHPPLPHRRPPARRTRPRPGVGRLGHEAGPRRLRGQGGGLRSAELLRYSNRELASIRRLAAQFAEEHPKIAGRLRLGAESGQDPHVERLIEAFAYLAARTRQKLEDEFPEITESLLGVLYPHYQAPLPAMAIVQLE